MIHPLIRKLKPLAWLLALSLLALSASAQNWPTKPVKIVTAASTGSGPDVALRVVADQLAKKWGQPVVVENKPGGNGVVAISATRTSANDGTELIHLDSSMMTSNMHLYAKLPYDAANDFEMIRPTLSTEFFIVVGKDSPFKSVDDIVAAARAKPEGVTYGSWGMGSPGHLGVMKLASLTNTKMLHVSYKEMPQLYAAVATGEVQWALGSLASAGPMEKAGRVKFIGVGAPQPSVYYPSAAGMSASTSAKGFTMNAWFGLFAPKGTPKAVREKIAADITEILAMPDVVDRYKGFGYNRFDMKPDDFSDFIASETKVWGKVISEAKLKLD